ncbi:MAG: ATP-binding protein [Gammaproteobacteria bacterium]|nr:ATP-binding protein [Gammaproteobacteria bacterium]
MIHEFTVSNFLSVGEEAVIDLRIRGTAPDLNSFRHSGAKPSLRLPTAIVLMGPNGSGKTTMLTALVRALQIASARLGDSTAIESVIPFMSAKTRRIPTRFCLVTEEDWLAPGDAPQVFRYIVEIDHGVRSVDGFESLADRSVSVRSEKLFHFPRGRPRRLLDRGSASTSIYTAPEFGLRAQDDRLKAVRPDSSAISTLNELNVELAGRIAERFRSYLHSTNLDPRGSLNEAVLGSMSEVAPELIRRVGRDIHCADLGIRGMELRDGNTGRTFWFEHEGVDAPIPLGLESHGTQRLLQLLPQIGLALDTAGLAVFDEVDADLHVDLANELIGWFRSRVRNPKGAQLFLTTHNVGLLDDCEKEELFIVEKDSSGSTQIHGAQDVEGLRRDARLYPKYRAGAIGGIPSLG